MNDNIQSGKILMRRRIGAFLIDYIIVSLIVLTPAFLWFLPKGDIDNFFTIFPFVLIGAFIGCTLKDVVGGRSIGKRVFGLFVREQENITNVPSVSKLIQRNLLIFLWPVEYISACRDSEGRRLGDKCAKTQVVGCVPKHKWTYVFVGIAVFILLYLSLSTIITQSIRNDISYNTAVQYIQSQEDILLVTGDIESFGSFPRGSLQYTNGHGRADLYIRVNGELNNLVVHILLTRELEEEWIVDSLEY